MSATHRIHPDREQGYPGDPVGAILYDDCERCGEQATDALGLDLSKLRQAWDIMVAVETGKVGNPLRRRGYLTGNEARLGRVLYAVFVVNERLARR